MECLWSDYIHPLVHCKCSIPANFRVPQIFLWSQRGDYKLICVHHKTRRGNFFSHRRRRDNSVDSWRDYTELLHTFFCNSNISFLRIHLYQLVCPESKNDKYHHHLIHLFDEYPLQKTIFEKKKECKLIQFVRMTIPVCRKKHFVNKNCSNNSKYAPRKNNEYYNHLFHTFHRNRDHFFRSIYKFHTFSIVIPWFLFLVTKNRRIKS